MRSGRWRAREVTEAALAVLAERDPAVGGFTAVRGAEAVSEAEQVDADPVLRSGVLAGVPIALKEEYDVTGMVTTLGGVGNSTPVTRDGEVVRRLRAAGAVIVGKTAMSEFGQVPITESAATGITRNPWDPARTPMGSSGGSAVAVATGVVPIALGADGGGSIRLPASACGLVGLKPTRGRVTLAPLSQHWFSLVVPGGLTRTVTDSALLLDVIAGSLPSDRWQWPAEAEPFLEQASREPGRLRIMWATNPMQPTVRTDPQVEGATESLARSLGRLGHRVWRAQPRWPVSTPAFLPQFYAGMRDEAAAVEHPERLEPNTRRTAALGRAVPAAVVEAAVRRGQRMADDLDRDLLTDADVLLTPTMPGLPPAVGSLAGLDAVRASLASVPLVANMALVNVTGHPAISVPVGLSQEGWPIGVQLIARRGQEGLLLSLAAEIERERPFPRLA